MASYLDLQPPLLIVDDTHHGAWVAIAAAFGLTLTLVCLLIRLYVRIAVSPPFGIDDLVLLFATVSEREKTNERTKPRLEIRIRRSN